MDAKAGVWAAPIPDVCKIPHWSTVLIVTLRLPPNNHPVWLGIANHTEEESWAYRHMAELVAPATNFGVEAASQPRDDLLLLRDITVDRNIMAGK